MDKDKKQMWAIVGQFMGEDAPAQQSAPAQQPVQPAQPAQPERQPVEANLIDSLIGCLQIMNILYPDHKAEIDANLAYAKLHANNANVLVGLSSSLVGALKATDDKLSGLARQFAQWKKVVLQSGTKTSAEPKAESSRYIGQRLSTLRSSLDDLMYCLDAAAKIDGYVWRDLAADLWMVARQSQTDREVQRFIHGYHSSLVRILDEAAALLGDEEFDMHAKRAKAMFRKYMGI